MYCKYFGRPLCCLKFKSSVWFCRKRVYLALVNSHLVCYTDRHKTRIIKRQLSVYLAQITNICTSMGNHSKALPVTRQFTRSTGSSSSSASTYIPNRSRTVTYQRSFFIRACRTWNVLPAELRSSHISLAPFKSLSLQYYKKAPVRR